MISLYYSQSHVVGGSLELGSIAVLVVSSRQVEGHLWMPSVPIVYSYVISARGGIGHTFNFRSGHNSGFVNLCVWVVPYY